ncbi:MarR family winged helix-turn-helix transcriptional regulator [Aquabacterium sp.]|uniref:MarR family winged helix-turn-helix transcriptional regulator n=1 Tax=Aquabacterium sp. TaxID=1872578 RepID=UPI002CEB0874|nr:MarR family transcriptional regulator [Aquabacterium sp.]HSW04790.1 MarR family transcriptional regulator [Aquabacterium sp.]
MPSKPEAPAGARTVGRAGVSLSPAATLAANHLGVLWTTLDAALTPAFGELSAASAALLQWLHHWAPMGVVELARIAGLSQPACTRAVDRLVQQGLLRRLPASGKEVPLALTPKGSAAARRMQAQRLHACDQLLAPLSAAERESLLALVHKLVQAPVSGRAYARHVCRYCDHVSCDGPACPVGCRASELEAAPGSEGHIKAPRP